jgi:AraC-like DNA-binding protein/ligand-binding sensor protein
MQSNEHFLRSSILERRRIVLNPPITRHFNYDQPNGAKSVIFRSNLAQGDEELLGALISSKVFEDYQHAFTEATGLPLTLRSVRSWQLAHYGRRNEGPVCALLAQKNRSCGVCLAVVEKLSEAAAYVPRTIVCHVGLSESAVPIRLGDRLIGFLQTGQVFCKAPSEGQFQRVIKLLGKWEVELDRDALRKAYFGTRVWSVNQYKSVIELLSIFAQHLSILSSQLLVHRTSQAPVIAKAKAYIREHFAEKLSLNHVAKVANVSRFHFCKLFKTATGLRFTDYVSRVRTEKAMNLLLNPNLRIGEIAFEVGFQSITHFNRKFRDNFGQTPTRYRSRLRVSLC